MKYTFVRTQNKAGSPASGGAERQPETRNQVVRDGDRKGTRKSGGQLDEEAGPDHRPPSDLVAELSHHHHRHHHARHVDRLGAGGEKFAVANDVPLADDGSLVEGVVVLLVTLPRRVVHLKALQLGANRQILPIPDRHVLKRRKLINLINRQFCTNNTMKPTI